MRNDNGQDRAPCLVCGALDVAVFLDLGDTALANHFLRADELGPGEAKYPLRIGFCPHCNHVQLTERVAPEAMFEHYLYVSSASETLKGHLDDLARELVARYRLGANDLVVDIGCNDNTLLRSFRRFGVRVLGIDPAANLAEFAGEDIPRYTGFFGSAAAGTIVSTWGHAALVTATNTFPHIQDLQDFVDGILTVLRPGGALVMEMHYLLDLLEQAAFDTIYHEHVSYWALGPMQRLFEAHGMEIVDAERLSLHHGQLRVHVQRRGERGVCERVGQIVAAEGRAGLNRFETYAGFARRALKIKHELHGTLCALARIGRRVAGYGAPAKGNTLLGFLNIGPEILPYIVDRSPLKQGLYTPGTHIPVVAPDRLLSDQPDYLLLLAWNFADEILAQQAEYRKRGGKFMVPLPEVRVLEG
ncbi:MAG TPA: class I SAM-dependent methyltransferase [Candidatus Eisenbacteria bacterium]|nr:class I SAM-dependent methyltransferase [Candidatus Eisenbacteria bacterium]